MWRILIEILISLLVLEFYLKNLAVIYTDSLLSNNHGLEYYFCTQAIVSEMINEWKHISQMFTRKLR